MLILFTVVFVRPMQPLSSWYVTAHALFPFSHSKRFDLQAPAHTHTQLTKGLSTILIIFMHMPPAPKKEQPLWIFLLVFFFFKDLTYL